MEWRRRLVVAGGRVHTDSAACDGGGAPLLRPLRGSLSLGGYFATSAPRFGAKHILLV